MEANENLSALLLEPSARRRELAQRLHKLVADGLRRVGKHDPETDSEIAGEVADDLHDILRTTVVGGCHRCRRERRLRDRNSAGPGGVHSGCRNRRAEPVDPRRGHSLRPLSHCRAQNSAEQQHCCQIAVPSTPLGSRTDDGRRWWQHTKRFIRPRNEFARVDFRTEFLNVFLVAQACDRPVAEDERGQFPLLTAMRLNGDFPHRIFVMKASDVGQIFVAIKPIPSDLSVVRCAACFQPGGIRPGYLPPTLSLRCRSGCSNLRRQ